MNTLHKLTLTLEEITALRLMLKTQLISRLIEVSDAGLAGKGITGTNSDRSAQMASLFMKHFEVYRALDAPFEASMEPLNRIPETQWRLDDLFDSYVSTVILPTVLDVVENGVHTEGLSAFEHEGEPVPEAARIMSNCRPVLLQKLRKLTQEPEKSFSFTVEAPKGKYLN